MSVSPSLARLFHQAPAARPSSGNALGMARTTDPLRAEELHLRAKLRAAGPAGARINIHDVSEVLASFDLHRRGEIEPTDEPWRYRAKR